MFDLSDLQEKNRLFDMLEKKRRFVMCETPFCNYLFCKRFIEYSIWFY